MRDLYYGDVKDLVKWGVLLTLAKKFSVIQILQVAYYRPDSWSTFQLEIDGKPHPFPSDVIAHFRNVRKIENISTIPNIKLLDTEFKDRNRYLKEILKIINANGDYSRIIFLDPDNGLEPVASGFEHVLESEVSEIWKNMHIGDVLVLYQHKTTYDSRVPWIEEKRSQLESALGLPFNAIKVAQGPRISAAAVLFYCRKDG